LLLAACFCAAAAGVASPVRGQAPVPPPSPVVEPEDPYDGRVVARIDVVAPVKDRSDQTEPAPDRLSQLVLNTINLKVGLAYRRATVLSDVALLNRLGRFRRVESAVRLLSDGSVSVTYLAVEQPVIRNVQTVGNRLLTDQDIIGALGVVVGTPVDRFQIDRAARTIEDLYRQKGYYLAHVTIDEKELEDSGNLIFRVREGDRVRVTDIRFDGNASFSARELRTAIRTREADLLFETGPLDDDVLADDVSSLATFYRDRGYLDVRTDRRIQPSPDNREAIVTFLVDEGPLYSLRDVRVRFVGGGEAAPRFTQPQIAGLLLLKSGDIYSARRVDQSVKAVEAAYAKLGYYDVVVRRQEVRDVDRPLVDIVVSISEGRAYKTGRVVIQRNDVTRQDVIQRQLQIRPERPLDREAIDESRDRLENLGIFERGKTRLTVQPPNPDDPDHRDVLVEVQETNTGSFNIMAAVSSDLGVVGGVSVVERNFDLGNPPDSLSNLFSGAFRGGGQTLSLLLQPGTVTQDYALSLTEPYLLDSDNSLTGTVSYRKRDYKQYDEQRYGGKLTLGRRFGSRWEGDVTFRNEWVSLSGLSDDSPKDFFDAKNLKLISAVGAELARTTTDDRFRPGRGTRLELGVEQAGIYGDYSFTKLRAEYSVFFTLNEAFEGERTILSLSGKAAYIPQGPDAAPTYERFNLGGRTFRGFDFRTISPKGLDRNGNQTNEPVGGTWSLFLGAQVEQPVYQDMVSVVGFIDSGTVTDDIGVDQYRVSVGTGIRLNIRQFSPVPIALDFGFPLVKQFGDRERVVTFFIDIPY
jgi:outer membrane protein insertion porin family